MLPTDKLENLLGTVGLLRARTALLMDVLNERKHEFQSRHEYPPLDLNQLMIKTHDNVIHLLKASDLLVTAQGNLRQLPLHEKVFRFYLHDFAISQSAEKLKWVLKFYEELTVFQSPNFEIPAYIYEEAILMIREALEYQSLS